MWIQSIISASLQISIGTNMNTAVTMTGKRPEHGPSDPARQKALLQGIKIPPRPDVLAKFHAEMQKPYPDLGALARQVGNDVSLSGAVLQVVNSPLFRLPKKIASIDQAIQMLGLVRLASVVRAVSMKASLAPALKLDRFWDTAEDVARAGAYLAKRHVGLDAEALYAVGLFHDCGIPLLLMSFPDYKALLQRSKDVDDGDSEHSIAKLEKESFGITHAEVGYRLGQAWFLPEPLCQVIAIHHQDFGPLAAHGALDEKLLTMCALLKVARRVSARRQAFLRSQGADIPQLSQPVLDYLGYTPEDCAALEDAALECLDVCAD